MQGVDRHDQLRAAFALTKRHGFKKWYVKMWLALIDIALTYASICYFLKNSELKKKEGHHCCFYADISTFLVDKGEMYDWDEQFGSKDNDFDVFQPKYNSDDEGSGLEDDVMDDQLLRDLGVDCVTPDTGHGGSTSANGTLC
jgi:hypothetical protein